MKTLLSTLMVVVALSCTRTEKPAPVEPARGPSVPAFDPSGVEALLNAHESPHADAEVWKRLGPAAHVYLRQLVQNEQQDVTRRMRAAEAMSFGATAEDVALLERLAKDSGQHELVRKGALTGMALGDPARAVARLTPFLSANERGVRARSIELLGALGTPDARAALQQVATSEGPEKNRAMRMLAKP
jgi:HEAT repeat protein